MDIEKIISALEAYKPKSAWSRGVHLYAIDLLEDALDGIKYGACAPSSISELRTLCLNGAENWACFSWGGSSLIYDEDIARRTCTPSELKKTQNGQRRPNKREEWLDVQTRALHQAFALIRQACHLAYNFNPITGLVE